MKIFKNKKYFKTKIFFLIIIIFYVFFLIFGKYFFGYEINFSNYSTTVFDKNGIYLGEIKKDDYFHKYRENYPENLKNILIGIEDKRFYHHHGIDYIAILRALENNIFSSKRQGASTIEAQLVRQNNKSNSKIRDIPTKINEFIKAYRLNYTYSKNEIINMYLNNIPFESNVIGFASASEYYYGKEIENLTNQEYLGLVTIINNPLFYSPNKYYKDFKNRFEKLKKAIIKNKVIIENLDYFNIDNIKFIRGGNKNYDKNSNYFLNFLKTDENIYNSTIDLNLTNEIKNIADNTIKSLNWKDVGDYGVIVIDTKNMDLKVMIGGIDYDGENGQVNSTTSLRQAGSTLKPFLYLKYFKDFGKTGDDKIIDAPIGFETAEGNLYSPKNYSLDYKYEVSLKESLSQSLNVPAVKILNEVGVDNFINLLHDLGLNEIKNDKDFYGLSLALGSAEIKLIDLVRAYSIFFDEGNLCEINTKIGEKTTCKNIIEKEYIDMIYEILSNRYYKLEGFGINSTLDFENLDVFYKTGTSRNFKDNWTIGGFDNYLIGVWVGNKDATEMKGVSGASGAGTIFKKIINLLNTNNSQTRNIGEISDKNIQYLNIIKPVNYSTFLKIGDDFIQTDFKSNIDYDDFKWFLNGEEINDLKLSELINSNILEIKLYKNGEIIKTDKINIFKE